MKIGISVLLIALATSLASAQIFPGQRPKPPAIECSGSELNDRCQPHTSKEWADWLNSWAQEHTGFKLVYPVTAVSVEAASQNYTAISHRSLQSVFSLWRAQMKQFVKFGSCTDGVGSDHTVFSGAHDAYAGDWSLIVGDNAEVGIVPANCQIIIKP